MNGGEDNERLLSQLNGSNNQGKNNSGGGGSGSKKKKIGAIVGVVLIAVTIIIIVAATGGSDDPDKPPGPGPVPPPTPGGPGYNPYSIAETVDDGKAIKGFLQASSHKAWTHEERRAYTESLEASDKVGVLDPRVILEGTNNQLVQNISFEMGTANPHCTYLWMDDAANPRFSPPLDSVNRPNEAQSIGMRNDMNGMSISTKKGFSFKFLDNRNSSNVLLDSEGGNFIMMDKYTQMDMNLPSRRIYGLGERNRNFTLEEGTWTMWANGQETPYDDGTGGL